MSSSSRRAPRSPSAREETAEFGRRVRARRLALGWTLETAAEHAGLDPMYVQKVEAGRVNVTLATARRLARGLHVEVADLVPGQAPEPRPEPADGPPRPSLATLGRRMFEARVTRGLTQSEVAAEAGVALRTVQKSEAGRQNLTVASLLALAGALDVPVVSLFATTRDDASARPASRPRIKAPVLARPAPPRRRAR